MSGEAYGAGGLGLSGVLDCHGPSQGAEACSAGSGPGGHRTARSMKPTPPSRIPTGQYDEKLEQSVIHWAEHLGPDVADFWISALDISTDMSLIRPRQFKLGR